MPRDMPRPSSRGGRSPSVGFRKTLIISVVGLILNLVILRIAAEVHLEYLWYDSLLQPDTWLTATGAKFFLGIVFSLVFFLACLSSLTVADRVSRRQELLGADEFMLRLEEITRGEAEFSAEVANQLLEMFIKKSTDMAELPERQVEILRLVSQGLTYRAIGDRLYLTERTVKYHMGEILSRLHLKGRQEAEEYARRRGLA